MTDDQMEILKRLQNIRIRYPQYESILKRIEDAHNLWKRGAQPRNLMIIGPSGAGKSTILNMFRQKHPTCEKPEYRHIPVLYVGIPPTPTLRNCAEEILVALGEPLSTRGSATEKTIQIVQLLKHCRVEIILFDELHHFLKKGKRVSVEDVSEWLKVLIDRAGIPVVLTGLPDCKQLFRANEQLRRRFSASISMEPFKFDSDEDCILFRNVLHALGNQINPGTASEMLDWDLVRRIHFATNGLIGYVQILLATATEIMLEGNYSRIHAWMLESAFTTSIWEEGQNKLNPFNPNFIFRRLTGPKEPFEPTSFTGNLKVN